MSRSQDAHVVPFAEIDWANPETPQSKRYKDVYWSLDQGLSEKHHVFIEGNELPLKFSNLKEKHFAVFEVGFGFGLNFLLTADAWRRAAPQNSVLNFFSVEKSPVSPADLAHLYKLFNRTAGRRMTWLRTHTTQLLQKYPLPSAGYQTFWIDDDIALTLIIDDLATALEDFEGHIDAWFLDGFSPSKNNDAWTDDLYRKIASSSHEGASFSTYSVAGIVRRGLSEAGLEIERQAGFGNKAEMLCGRAPGHWQACELEKPRVAIIGAGIAGLNLAHALNRRHIEYTLFDSNDQSVPALPAFAVAPQLAVRPHIGSLFSLSAFHYASSSTPGFQQQGRLTLPKFPGEEERLQRIAKSFPESMMSYREDNGGSGGLTFDHGGWIDPEGLRDQQVVIKRQVKKVLNNEVVFSDSTSEAFDAIVFATGAYSLPDVQPLHTGTVRGQAIKVTLTGDPIRQVIGGPLYIIPLADDEYIVGATYDKSGSRPYIKAEDTNELCERVVKFTGRSVLSVMAEYAGVRCTTRDRTPIVGPVPNWEKLEAYCARSSSEESFEGYEDNRFVLTGFGSHGATHAPLCAEFIARMMTGEPSCLTTRWRARLDPARFRIRDSYLNRV